MNLRAIMTWPGGAPTLVDMFSCLGMGREGESGETWVGKNGKGVGLGARCGVPLGEVVIKTIRDFAVLILWAGVVGKVGIR